MTDLRIAEVNYDAVTENFVEFLRGQEEFKDVDFEASAIRRLISILAYDMHYKSYYANASFKENFIDSAVLRSSIVSNAKRYGYTPRSVSAPKALVDVKLQNGSTIINNFVELPKGSRFKGKLKDRTGSFDFVTTQSYSIFSDKFDLVFNDVELVQGSYVSLDYRADRYSGDTVFEIPYDDVDTDFLEVYVQIGSDDSTFVEYTKANNLLTGPDDEVYWLEEGVNGRYQIHFGDGVIGKSIEHGNIVRMNFIRTSGIDANNVSEFTFSNSSTQFNNYLSSVFSSVSITTLSRSQGGADRESNEEIKFRAAKYRGNGANALRLDDYRFRIRQEYPEISSVRVWDANSLDDPTGSVGKIFISAVPTNGKFFTQTKKNSILSGIENNIAGSLRCFEFVDPSYIKPIFNVDVELKEGRRKVNSNLVRRYIRDAILSYTNTNLTGFDTKIEYSDVIVAVQNSDKSIDNIILNITLSRSVDVDTTVTSLFDVEFDNSFAPNSLTSTKFVSQGASSSFTDDGQGNLIFNGNIVGRVDYTKGKIISDPFQIDNVTNSRVDFFVNTNNRNLSTKSSNIFLVEESQIVINIINEEL